MMELQGVIIPLVTPFLQDGRISCAMLRRNIMKWNETDIGGYMCLGTNGEFKSLTDEEARQIIDCFTDTASPKKVRIVGIGRESLYQTLEFMKSLHPFENHIDYYSVITPCYFRRQMTDDALFAFYTCIADESPVPILLYTAPSYANQVVISPDLLCRLADHPNILGIKDTSPDMMPHYVKSAGGRKDFHILAGSIKNLLLCLDGKGEGGVISAANYLPNACADIITRYNRGDRDGAAALIKSIQAVMTQTASPYGVSGVKASMDIMGYEGGYPRIPLLPVSETEKQRMETVFRVSQLS